MTQQNHVRRRSSDLESPEHITAEWVLLAIKNAFGERSCSDECKEVAVLKQEVKDNKEILLEIRSDVKAQSKASTTTMWAVIFAMAGFIGTLITLLLGK
jgi:hypothetical protein